ncbi:MAG: acyl-[acyl-carrier-protein]--UDP-N-acetylglucosamine O-acyltransferase [Pirellulaceae bacterium]|nr:MAG: acyl-[acyl-carrier-protein]--UDP-N-acetylglucosamine O-acyltransferase [Pirellulaceae bacterium]
MATIIAHTAVVDPRAELDEDVRVGHHCVIGPHVRIGRGTRLENNVTLTGHTTIGRNNHLFPGVVIGAEPQDLSYQGSPTQVVIGDENVFRESVTVNRATEKEDGITSIGSQCYFMACSHVAHDCRVGDRVIMANNVMLGGHVHVHHDATLSGGCAVHHFASIGCFSFVSGLSRVLHDVPPFMLVEGFPARPRTVNVVALKRKNFSPESIKALMEAYRLLYRSRVGVQHAREILFSNGPHFPELQTLFEFIEMSQGGRHGRGRDRRKAA